MKTDKFNEEKEPVVANPDTEEIMSVAGKIVGHINQVETKLSDRIEKSEVRITNLEDEAKK